LHARGLDDGIIIAGGRLQGGVTESYGDHRIAMAFTIAGLAARGPVTIRDCANIDTSFPGFADVLDNLGSPVAMDTVSDG